MEKYGRWPFFEPKNLGKSLEATVDTGGDYRPGVPEGGRSGYGEGYPAGMWLQPPFRAGNSLLISWPERTRRQENGQVKEKKCGLLHLISRIHIFA